MKYLYPAASIVGTAVTVFYILKYPGLSVAALAAAGLVALIYWARDSAARIGAVSVLLIAVIPLMPGLQETRTPQMTAMLGVSLPMAVAAFRLAAAHGRRVRGVVVPFVTVAALTLLSVGVLQYDQFRILAGMVIASTLALSIAVGLAAERGELQTMLKFLTLLAYIAAGIALLEAVKGAPLYEFTEFQTHASSRVGFRASSIFGHPLVLCVFMSAVALLNIARPAWDVRRWYLHRVLTVGLPLAGAAASGSRSLFLFLGVGILAVLATSKGNDGVAANGGARFLVAATAAGLGVLGVQSGGVLAGRFDQLSMAEQAIRLGGFNVVTRITSGYEIVFGGGPRSVQDAYSHRLGGARFGTVDNQLLTAYADMGAIGFVLIFALALIVLAGLRRSVQDSWQRAYSVAGIVMVVAFFVMEPLAWPILAVLFGFGVGASLVRVKVEAAVEQPQPSQPVLV